MSEKIKLKGQLKLPVVGRNPIFAQMKFVKVALSEPDILPDSGSIFTCDEQGNYDFEIYTGAHLLSYNVGNAWSKPIEIIAEPLAEGLESIEISDLIGFQEIPELDATIAALNQQKQELLSIQQDVTAKQTAVTTASNNINDTIDNAKEGFPDLMLSYLNSLAFYVNSDTGDDLNDGLTTSTPKRTIDSIAGTVPHGSVIAVYLMGSSNHTLSKLSQFQHCIITVTAHSSMGATKPVVEQSPSADGFGRFGGEGNLFRFMSVKLLTAKFESGDTYNPYSSAMIRGSGVNTAYIYSCDIELRDSALTYQHVSGIGSWMDVLICNGSVTLGDKLTGSQYALIGTSSSSGNNAFKLQISNLSIPDSTTMRQLVLANTSSCLTNVPELRI